MLSRRELLVLLALFALSLPAVTARLYSSDEVEYFSYLRSLWFDHDVSFDLTQPLDRQGLNLILAHLAALHVDAKGNLSL